jgi:large subunit ribosomal protein L2
MAIKQYNPTSAGRRAGSVNKHDAVTLRCNAPEKSLISRQKKRGGRNNQGKITARHRGGGHKQMYRHVDYFRRTDGVPAEVLTVEYDPCRTTHICLIGYADGKKAYIIAPDGIKVGGQVQSGVGTEPVVGNAMPLSVIPLGMTVHNIEMQPGGGGKLCRSAGSSAVLNARDGNWAQITLPSGEVRRVPAACRATIGACGNAEHQNVSIGKAGRNRWRGIRPSVRGVAMNPVAHPMGGGEGRTSGGRHPCSPTGKLAKGGKTRKRRKPSSAAIVRRRWSRRNGQLIT